MKRQIIAHMKRYPPPVSVVDDLEGLARGGGKLPDDHPLAQDYLYDVRERYPGWTDEDFAELLRHMPRRGGR
jgi:hypothetical protein